MYVDRDFAKMRVKPLEDSPDYEKLFKGVPSIVHFDGYRPHKRKIVNYILFMYDPGSPFVKKFQDVSRRMKAVGDYTGLSKINKASYESITEYKDSSILNMIDEYVRWINIRLWSLIVSQEALFFEYQRELLLKVTEVDSKDKLQAMTYKQKVSDAMDVAATRLDGYYSELYAGDENMEQAVKKMRITPENVASGEYYAQD